MTRNKEKNTRKANRNSSSLYGSLYDEDKTNREFSARVTALREKLGLTQLLLAEKISVDKTTIQNYEKGFIPTGKNAILLARFFGVSIDYLLTGKEPVAGTPDEPPAPGPDFFEVDLVKGMQLLARIYESKDQVLIRAIGSNLVAFSQAADNKKLIDEQSRRIKKLEDECEDMRRRMADLERRLEARPCSGGVLGEDVQAAANGG